MTSRAFDTEALRSRGRLRRACALWAQAQGALSSPHLPDWLQTPWLQTVMNPESLDPPTSAQTRKPRHVAVYGTLRRGGSNDIETQTPAPRFIGTTTLIGKLFHLGSYPGLVLASAEQGGGPVMAEVYQVRAELEAVLDEIEAAYPSAPDEYAKRELSLSVRTAEGVFELPCFLYEVNPARVCGCPQIMHGDWMRAVS
jgi:gamma-glutamylcyclotransferase (GGCT)/AIG2-like uncharacterized protein YtfP